MGTKVAAFIGASMESSGVREVKPVEWGPQTHCGAERGNPPVSSTDGQVVEGNGLPVQLHILPDPQHPFHGRDQKLPWCHPGEASVS